jgi:vacuolar protein sorting-associated protein 13A/C
MCWNITPPLEVENLLPYDISYAIFDKDSRQQFDGFLRKGLRVPVHTVQLTHLLGLRIEVPDAGKYFEKI